MRASTQAPGSPLRRVDDGSRLSTHPMPENRWCQEHREELLRLAGEWVVVEPSGVVSHHSGPLCLLPGSPRATGVGEDRVVK